jgi:hypothetical protein
MIRLRLGYLTMVVGLTLFIVSALFGSEPFAIKHMGAVIARETTMMMYSSVLILFSMILLISSR